MKKSTALFLCSVLYLSAAFTDSAESAETYTRIETKEIYPILNPTLADRKTGKIILQNGLQVYLVSDPETKQSAAGVSMEAGSWEDPDSYPGTAHFLEHMLFMGTKEYPDESEYSKYIKDNGGSVNAFTASDRTVYMFSVNNEGFVGSLDRFSRFFIDPLFAPSSINRELRAVDQEFAKNVENDFWRSFMVLKETSSQGHPNTKFSIGNAETLSGIPQEALKEWYKSHYSSDKMHLVLLSPLPLETMIELVNEKFSKVEKETTAPAPVYGDVLSEKQKGHFLYVKPIRDLKTLSLIWELPKEFCNIDQKWTAALIGYVLDNASNESLEHLLKEQKMAESVSASVQTLSKNDYLFTLNVDLTDLGLSQMDTVISLCYQTIARVNQAGVPFFLFEELAAMAKIEYRYQSRPDPFSWVMNTANDLVDEELDTFPEKLSIPSHFDPESMSRFTASLTPESCLYLVLADPEKLGITTDKTEKWMHVPYKLEPVGSAKLASWKNQIPNPAIQIPPPNPFIPSSLEPVAAVKESETGSPVPVTLIKNEKSLVYFAKDTQYLLPESSYIFNIKTPAIDGSATSQALADLLSKALYDKLSPALSFAEHAGLSSEILTQNMNFSVHVYGYSEKAFLLVKEIFESLRNFNCTGDDFDVYKTSLLTVYANGSGELPVKQAAQIAYNILLNDAPTPSLKEAALKKISFEDFLGFYKSFFDTIYLEGMLYGNLTEKNANDTKNFLEQIFSSSSPYKEYKKESILLLPSDKGPFKVMEKTERQGNGTVLVIEQGPFSPSKKASSQILSVALADGFFDTLRTKQQTAYIAQTWDSEVDKQLLQTFAVQSGSHLPEDLLHRFELFLEDFQRRLSEIVSKERFEQLKNSEITSLQIPPQNIHAMGCYLAGLAFKRDGDFMRPEKQIRALEQLSYEEFLADSEAFISKSNPRRLAVLMEGEQLPQKPLQYAEIAKEDMVKIGTSPSM